MRVLFISSGRKGFVNPIIQNQGRSLRRAGVEVDFFMVSGSGWRSYVRDIKPLRSQIKSGNYDVIHPHYAFCAYLVNLAAIGLHKPLVVSLMGSDIWQHKWYPAFVRMWARLWRWKAIIVKSKEMRERVGIPKAMVIPNGVDMERFSEEPRAKCQEQLGWDAKKLHVLFPADPGLERKNWPLAFEAVKLLQKRLNELTNEIIVRDGARKVRVNGIELHGMVGVPNEQTPIMYNAADAVVLPSFYEGSANAVKEAMACNAPLVTTDMGDCRERMEGIDGCYVAKTYDVEEFAELLEKALKYGKTKGRERLLADGIADWQIARKLTEIYECVMCKVYGI